MLDFDIAAIYEVETRTLNQAVKRNIELFPNDFMFQLTNREFTNLMSQVATSKHEKTNVEMSSQIVMTNLKSQNVTSSWGGTRKLPYAFTEHGVTMLANVLKSKAGNERYNSQSIYCTKTVCA